jgi:hypothetical protein
LYDNQKVTIDRWLSECVAVNNRIGHQCIYFKTEPNHEKIIETQISEIQKQYDEKLNTVNEELAKERLKTRELELASKSEIDRAKFLEDEAKKAIDEKVKALEAENKSYKEKEAKIEFDKNILKLKADNPHLTEELDDITNYEELNAFLKIKPKLDKKYSELKMFREANNKAGINAMAGEKPSNTNNINVELAKKLKEEAIAEFKKNNSIK